MIKIDLPIPDKTLNPNTNGHWYYKSTIKSKTRKLGNELAGRYKGFISNEVRLKIKLIVFKKSTRFYDLDNLLSSCKSVLDGVFDAIGCNDNQVDDIRVIRGGVDKLNPRIELFISEIKE